MGVRNDVIEKRPEVVERYVIGMAEATWYTRQNRDEAAEISTRWVPGLEPAVAKKALANLTFDARDHAAHDRRLGGERARARGAEEAPRAAAVATGRGAALHREGDEVPPAVLLRIFRR
jgi:ABC-type nitrate/sulfonate/bicarbonate transport system substrate-binding protein